MKAKTSYTLTTTVAALAAAFALNAAAQTAPAKPAADPQAQAQASVAAQATTPTAVQGTADLQPGSVDAAAATSAEPKDFIRKAYLANEFGIAASQVALAQSKTPATKAAAQKILTDGMKERQDMIAAIQKATSDMHFDQSWDDKYKQMLADLKSAPEGKTFDAKYVQLQGAVSDQSASLFSQYAQNGTDTAVKTFAAATLPTIQADSSQLKAVGG